MKLDKLQRSEFHKAVTPSVAIMWHGAKTIDQVDGVFGSVGDAMATAGGGDQPHVTMVDLATPSQLTDGRVWVLLNGGGIFSAHCSAADAARAQGISGGRFRSFVLNAAPAAVTASGIPAAERAAIAAFAGAGAEMSKAAFTAIKDALAKPLSAAKSLWR